VGGTLSRGRRVDDRARPELRCPPEARERILGGADVVRFQSWRVIGSAALALAVRCDTYGGVGKELAVVADFPAQERELLSASQPFDHGLLPPGRATIWHLLSPGQLHW
jgi:hypothetical protein